MVVPVQLERSRAKFWERHKSPEGAVCSLPCVQVGNQGTARLQVQGPGAVMLATKSMLVTDESLSEVGRKAGQ